MEKGLREPLIVVQRFPYEEPYNTAISIFVSVGHFSGSISLYCAVSDLAEIGAALKGFPTKASDEYRYDHGSETENAYRYFLLRAYTTDGVGHCALQVHMDLKEREPNEGICRFSIKAEPAAINRLGELFEQFGKLEHLEMRWSLKEGQLYDDYVSSLISV